MADPRVLFEIGAGIARITLNRPEKRNALDARTVHELKEAVARADADANARVMLLAGRGPDFCAGLDLAELAKIADLDMMANLEDAQSLGDLFVRMRRASKPIVAAVQGHAIAGGAGLATAADMIVASDTATFGYPEVQLGFVPAIVLALLRRGVGEKVAFDLAATGRRFDAEEAHRIGLVSRVLAADRFEAESNAFAADLAGRSASALLLIKRVACGGEGLSFEDAMLRGAEINALARTTPDFREGMRRFLER